MASILEARVTQAAHELGQTAVRPAVAWLLRLGFALCVVVVPALEIARDSKRDSGSAWPDLAAAPAHAWQLTRRTGALAGNRALHESLIAFEAALEERSLLGARARPRFQELLTRWLGAGNEQVVTGRRGWLYFRPSLDYLTGPGFLEPGVLKRGASAGRGQKSRHPDPVPALADFAARLAERGIGLVVVPTPVKAALHPEGLSKDIDESDLPLQNPSLASFLARLADLEIPAYIPDTRLAAAKHDRSWPQFLRTDTHWTPEAVENAARGLADFVDARLALPERRPVAFTRRLAAVLGRGDLLALLGLPASQRLYQPERIVVQRVFGPSGEPWRADPGADVLVLGDSFTNIYSQGKLGFGESAGFAAQLSYALRRPVDALAVNAGGPSAVRERLRERLAAGEDRLAGKRLVVYQFAARELAHGDWRLVGLDAMANAGATRPRRPEDALPARGALVWESSRSGDWRIWTRRLEGSPPRQLSPDEPGLQHCCAHLSPDGSRLVYLSRSVSKDEYPEFEVPGELRLLRLDGAGGRTLTSGRPYGWGNRAALWRNDRELIHVGPDGRTRLLDVESGASSWLTEEPRTKLAWLIDATLSHAVSGSPTFSSYDAAKRRVRVGRRFPGCEPYFSHDGRFGFWVERGGGPIRLINLASREIATLLEHEDPSIPGAQRYLYFPMLSRDGRLLAFGASSGDHDHFRSNYDAFVAPVDPATLTLQGRPLRLTAHPASDRYPDVHVETLDVERWRREAPPVPQSDPATHERPVAAGPLDVRAVFRVCSRVPSLREISPYRDALVVCEWQIVEAGAASGRRLRVAHWGLRGGERQAITSTPPGVTARLRLEPLVGTVQLDGYALSDSLPPAGELPLYYDAGED